MWLEQACFISGIVAAFSVVGSLIYMATQVRQNTMSVRMSTGRAVTEELRALYRGAFGRDT